MDIDYLKEIIDKLSIKHCLTFDEWLNLFNNRDKKLSDYLFKLSKSKSQEMFGKNIYIRGLIEISSYCKNDCYYCGIRKSNLNVNRYRLTKDDILNCCKKGYNLGFRTFVMQGGEDLWYSDDYICDIIYTIKALYKDCAVTLSLGEKSYDSYKKYFDAGADRYLLRHETANQEHYNLLHPHIMSLENRKKCLYNLKEIGYQVGCGFMVGSPYQTPANIIEDLIFIQDFKPHMVGIGPFIPHHDTKFASYKPGDIDLTIFCIGLLRLLLPKANIPATTAVASLSKNGRIRAINAGANVVMPNLSPINNRKSYDLYDNKISTGEEASESVQKLNLSLNKIGYKIIIDKGDYMNN